MNHVSKGRSRLALALVVTATLLGLMGTDLVLPAVPFLPGVLGGEAATAQLVLAAYVGGTAIGLLAFGAMGDRFATRTIFIVSLALTALFSLACVLAPNIETLIVLRALQGAAACGPAVFAAPIVHAMFDERQAVRTIGALGSIEALAPALAPILGAALFDIGGWTLSFLLMGGIALALVAANAAMPLIPQTGRRTSGSFVRLLCDATFMRYAISHAFVLGGLLVVVFGAPAVFTLKLGGGISDFIMMQVIGVAVFIACSNGPGALAHRFGAERLIMFGTAMSAVGAVAMLVFALADVTQIWVFIACFVPINAGLGLRGPSGFYRAVLASKGDDARGSALVILFIMMTSAIGTAVAAPFITDGMVPVALIAALIEVGAVVVLAALPRLPD